MKEKGRAQEARLGKAMVPHCPAGDAPMESAPFESKPKT